MWEKLYRFKKPSKKKLLKTIQETTKEHNELVTELINICLWSARRLPEQYREYAHKELEIILNMSLHEYEQQWKKRKQELELDK